jgi:hypothetical protein
MVHKVNVLLPIGESLEVPGTSKPALAPRLRSLQNSTIAVFANGWQCMNFVADELNLRLTADYGVKEVIKSDSPLTLPMPEHLMSDVVARCDAAIVGMGT